MVASQHPADPVGETPRNPGRVGVPDLVPARMVNEYAYCPRLFFLEWVHAQWADNLDTVEGREQHRRVDQPAGAAPLPEDGELTLARSLQLSSPELGLIATIDVAEGQDGVVRPVETKHGRPPDVPEGAWEPERVQVCVQGLLLREAGYSTGEGVIFYADARRRVTVPFTDELITRTHDLLGELREVAASDLPPPPLIDSPKCPRCSLVGICLPDETNALAARSSTSPRRLLPRDPTPRPLYVTDQGARLSKSGGRVEVRRRDVTLESIRLLDVSQVCLFGNVQITSQLLRALFAREIPVSWFSYGGWFTGMAAGLPSKHVDLRRRQVAVAGQGGLEVARWLVEGKIRNSRTLLRRNARSDVDAVLRSLKTLAGQAADAPSLDALLGFEGAAARLYFSALPAMLNPPHRLPGAAFAFEGRKRRPPPDPVNALLSYTYALLAKDFTAIAHTIGFDPYLGFLHRPRFGRPALALDLCEEFRPLIADSVVTAVINNGEIRHADFVVRAGGVALTSEARRKLIRAYERRLDIEVRHPTFGYRVSYRRVLEVQTRMLAAYVLGEIPAYQPFTTR